MLGCTHNGMSFQSLPWSCCAPNLSANDRVCMERSAATTMVLLLLCGNASPEFRAACESDLRMDEGAGWGCCDDMQVASNSLDTGTIFGFDSLDTAVPLIVRKYDGFVGMVEPFEGLLRAPSLSVPTPVSAAVGNADANIVSWGLGVMVDALRRSTTPVDVALSTAVLEVVLSTGLFLDGLFFGCGLCATVEVVHPMLQSRNSIDRAKKKVRAGQVLVGSLGRQSEAMFSRVS
jgi:hypothetical protein